ncbi:Bidirectional sugar transporter SWEET17 [Hibiscus syriacus]|uniref:Bidirectional sugar transporter SWEET17 n=2 Tax=Hibiscus syriacus TaxID=106335 RepID=A0A6A3CUJ5_HIBSY|nr:Bidirectional sugar transporter SWEET17 [Hibiscus syriacus]
MLVLFFLSPIATFSENNKRLKRRSTEDFESLPYVCTLLNSSLWTYYGITKPGGILVATFNGFGIFVEAVYVVLFLVYVPKNMKVKTGILVGIVDVGFLTAAIVVTQLALEGETRIGAIGFMGCGLKIIINGSPFAVMV